MKSSGQLKFEKHCRAIGSDEKWEGLDETTKRAWQKMASSDEPGGDAPPPIAPGQGPGGGQ